MTAYEQLKSRFARIERLNDAWSILSWDESVMMPTGGGQARGEVLAEIATLVTELQQADDLLDLVNNAEGEMNTDWDRANLAEMKRSVGLAQSVPLDLVRESSVKSTAAEQAWRHMRGENNWSEFKPYLEELVNLKRQEASAYASFFNLKPYDCLMQMYEPGGSSEAVETLFSDLKPYLKDLIPTVIEKQKSIPVQKLEGHFSIENQRKLTTEIMSVLGFNFTNGRVDETHHPFCGGTSQDVRITTRYEEDNFINGLMSTIHETGHANYEQNLPAQWDGQPVGKALGMSVHESQSLFFEMQLALTKEFLSYVEPKFKSAFPDIKQELFSSENMFNLVNRVEPSFIRVDADEVTYPMHVILRFEIEKGLIEGTVTVSDIPDLWNAKMSDYLGVDTKNNFKDGPMQDVHWPCGLFGYFPTYTMGAMTAAQLANTIQGVLPDYFKLIEKGELDLIRNWLSENVWQNGRLMTTDQMLTKATGEKLNAAHFKKYLNNKYLG